MVPHLSLFVAPLLPSAHRRPATLTSRRIPISHRPLPCSFKCTISDPAPAPRTDSHDGPASPSTPTVDLYSPFWSHADRVLQTSFPLSPYPIPAGFASKESITGKGARAQRVSTVSYAYQTPKIRQIRTAHVRAGDALQVLNFVMFPHASYDIPFFGADIVTLPGGHLIAIDMQPLFHTDAYYEKYYAPLKAVFEKHKGHLPWGGDFPDEAKQFFSPCFLWSRVQDNAIVQGAVFDAFKDYLDYYVKLVNRAEKVNDKEYRDEILKRHIAYVKYRAEKDPARGMFRRFYGDEWTEEYIHGFLFDLERKLEEGAYKVPDV